MATVEHGARPQRARSARRPRKVEPCPRVVRTLEETFTAFCGYGQVYMDRTNFSKLCKDCHLLKNEFTLVDADLLFASMVRQGERRLDFRQFKLVLRQIARRRDLDVQYIHAAIAAVGGPVLNCTSSSKISFHSDRTSLRDPSFFRATSDSSVVKTVRIGNSDATASTCGRSSSKIGFQSERTKQWSPSFSVPMSEEGSMKYFPVYSDVTASTCGSPFSPPSSLASELGSTLTPCFGITRNAPATTAEPHFVPEITSNSMPSAEEELVQELAQASAQASMSNSYHELRSSPDALSALDASQELSFESATLATSKLEESAVLPQSPSPSDNDPGCSSVACHGSGAIEVNRPPDIAVMNLSLSNSGSDIMIASPAIQTSHEAVSACPELEEESSQVSDGLLVENEDTPEDLVFGEAFTLAPSAEQGATLASFGATEAHAEQGAPEGGLDAPDASAARSPSVGGVNVASRLDRSCTSLIGFNMNSDAQSRCQLGQAPCGANPADDSQISAAAGVALVRLQVDSAPSRPVVVPRYATMADLASEFGSGTGPWCVYLLHEHRSKWLLLSQQTKVFDIMFLSHGPSSVPSLAISSEELHATCPTAEAPRLVPDASGEADSGTNAGGPLPPRGATQAERQRSALEGCLGCWRWSKARA